MEEIMDCFTKEHISNMSPIEKVAVIGNILYTLREELEKEYAEEKNAGAGTAPATGTSTGASPEGRHAV
jgi:hypothetical protein